MHHEREACRLTERSSYNILMFKLNAGMDESLTIRSITCLLTIDGGEFLYHANCYFHHNRKAIVEEELLL